MKSDGLAGRVDVAWLRAERLGPLDAVQTLWRGAVSTALHSLSNTASLTALLTTSRSYFRVRIAARLSAPLAIPSQRSAHLSLILVSATLSPHSLRDQLSCTAPLTIITFQQSEHCNSWQRSTISPPAFRRSTTCTLQHCNLHTQPARRIFWPLHLTSPSLSDTSVSSPPSSVARCHPFDLIGSASSSACLTETRHAVLCLVCPSVLL